MKKLVVFLVVVALLAGAVLTIPGMGDAMSQLQFPDFKDFFTKEPEFCTLTLQVGEGGTVDQTKTEYEKGETVTLSALPNAGYVFSGWFEDQSTYLTTAKTYSFVIERDTVLRAGFARKPEKMEGQVASYDELFGCDTNFSFHIYCDRADAQSYLQENLRVVDSDLLGTQWESHGTVPFTVSAGKEAGEFVISPADGVSYERGVTYVALLPEQEAEKVGAFLDPENAQNTMNFTIQEENKEEVSYYADIAYFPDCDDKKLDKIKEIVDDGLIAGEEGDEEDYIVVYGKVTLDKNSIFCVYGGQMDGDAPQLDENAFFGKVLRTKTSGGNTYVYYGQPSLSEIYEKLDVLYSGGVDMEGLGVQLTARTAKQVRSQIFSDSGFQAYVAAAQQAIMNRYNQHYDVQQLDLKNFGDMITAQVNPVVEGNRVKLDIQVSLNIELYHKDTQEQAAQFCFQMDIDKELELNTYFKLKEKNIPGLPMEIESYDFHVGVVDTQKLTMDVSFIPVGEEGFEGLDQAFSQEFSRLIGGKTPVYADIAEAFAKNGYAAQGHGAVPLLSLQYTVGMASFDLDVALVLHMQLGANLHYSTETVSEMTVGLRSGAKGPVSYKSTKNQASADALTLAGDAKLQLGSGLDAVIDVIGLAKNMHVAMGFEMGVSHQLSGCINLDSATYAGAVEAGGYWLADWNYHISANKGSEAQESDPSGKALLAYGYENAMLYYARKDGLMNQKNNSIAIMGEAVQLLDYDLLKVAVLDTRTGQISTQPLRHNAKDYTVHVQTGQYLQYEESSGKLSAVPGAPLYFEENITITVEARNVSWKKLESGSYNSFLPAVTVKVVCGDEDAYLAAQDSQMEKEFRVLYREYTPQNVSFLQTNFEKILSQVPVPESYASIVDGLVKGYMDNLFDTIQEYRGKETAGSREMENLFVSTEAKPFALTMEIFGGINNMKEFNKEQILDWVDQLMDSRAMYKTLIEFADSDSSQDLSEKFAALNQTTKDAVREALAEFDTEHAGDEAAQKISAAVRKILGL